MQQHNQQPLLAIIHFNDVYDIQYKQKQPKGGAAYFKTLVDQYRNKYQHRLTLFSGDCFSPSMLSNQYKGENMVLPMNEIGIDLACIGNHDLDYSLEHLMQLKSKTNFPWLLSNVYDKRTQRRLAQGQEYRIFQINGIKIGIFSLAEQEWIDTLMVEYHDICQYIDFIQFAQTMVEILRNKQNCDLIIALTHMMKYNDIKLAQKVDGIDLILGGHDHLKVHEKVKGSMVIKSGTNFENFSCIEIFKSQDQISLSQQQKKNKEVYFLEKNANWKYKVQLVQINHSLHNIQPDQKIKQYVKSIYSQFSQRQKRIIMYTKTPLDLRFKTIRRQQSSYLQFMASFYRHCTKTDCAFMNAGNFRADCLIEDGVVTYGQLMNVIHDNITIKIVTGQGILGALQNCVSMFPNLAGRFSALSGLSFTWDADQPPNSRILKETVKINGQSIDINKKYRVAMHQFMSDGGDGFAILKQFPHAPHEHAPFNIEVISLLESVESEVVKSFVEKYHERVSIIEVNGKKILQLNLPKPKNVLMIHSKTQ